MIRVFAMMVLCFGGGVLGALLAYLLGLPDPWGWILGGVGAVLGIWGGLTTRRPWDVVGSFLDQLIERVIRSFGRGIDIDLL